MVTVTILGAGVTGLTIASQLPVDWKIRIIGNHLPGDPADNDYASQWAGACWVGVPNSSARDQKMQLDAYAGLWRTASEYSDSGLRISEVTEIMEHGSPDSIWFRHIPGFRFLRPEELPPKATWGMTYKSIIVSPRVFISWLRKRLEKRGVEFERRNVSSLGELKGLGHDILINATGANSQNLSDVSDVPLVPYRLQSLVIDKVWDKGFIYRGLDGFYFNVFGRPDGTCYVGGYKDLNQVDRNVHDEQRQEILSRGNKVLPEVITSTKTSDYNILYDIATDYHFRTQEHGGTRVEQETLDDQYVIHAYGQEAGAFSYSFGVARAVSELAQQAAFQLPVSSRL